jgi:hypothetical protein
MPRFTLQARQRVDVLLLQRLVRVGGWNAAAVRARGPARLGDDDLLAGVLRGEANGASELRLVLAPVPLEHVVGVHPSPRALRVARLGGEVRPNHLLEGQAVLLDERQRQLDVRAAVVHAQVAEARREQLQVFEHLDLAGYVRVDGLCPSR